VREPGVYIDGDGLRLKVQASQGEGGRVRKNWVLRYTLGGKTREVGLGSADITPLAEAREKAAELRRQAKAGTDPLAKREQEKRQKAAEAARVMTFKAAAETYIAAHETSWKNPKHRQQWRNTLEAYAYPVIGAVAVADVDQAMVMAILDPIWRDKTETASRLRGRLEAVLDWATVRGHRKGENPARWRGHLQKALPARAKAQKVKHHAAIAFEAMPTFWQALQERAGAGADCLAFTVLTLPRSGEARRSVWVEIDMAEGVWTIPGERMKAGKAHRVPLSEAALVILRKRRKIAGDPGAGDLVFPSDMRKGATLSDMTLTALMRRMGYAETVHGFRSSFRTWADERTGHPYEVKEAALAHAVGDATVRAYARGDLFDRRRRLMDDWARYVTTPAAEAEGNVRPLRRAADRD
jgi:integrase